MNGRTTWHCARGSARCAEAIRPEVADCYAESRIGATFFRADELSPGSGNGAGTTRRESPDLRICGSTVSSGRMNTVHNARVQLLATALNNLGVGAILAGVVVPTVNATTPAASAVHLVIWTTTGASLIALAHAVLGRLRS